MTRRGRFLLKGALVWLLMPIAAIANGALRDLLLAPLLGARAVRSADLHLRHHRGVSRADRSQASISGPLGAGLPNGWS